MIGRILNGRYELGEVLGVGGMATVHRGYDHQLGRPVAVKLLNGGLADDPRFAERFAQEAQHAARLVHPRIVTVFDSGVDQGSPYIVMELVEGHPLSRLIADTTWLPVERAVGIASAVCEALEVAHAAGLVHRDIKPGNIMITQDGGVKVVDFGIARAGSSGAQLTQAAQVLGTASYLSPEQATASPLDGRSDLYSVGCVLTEMLTGAPPFGGDNSVAIAYQHVGTQPTPPSYRRPGLTPALDAVVLRLLAKNPADRPADAATARAELLAAVPLHAPADRTSELLAATQVIAPVPAHLLTGGQFPPPPRATSVLPPVPQHFAQQPYAAQPYGSHHSQDSHDFHDAPDHADQRPARRRNPLLYAGAGVVALTGAAVVALLTMGGPDDGTPKASAPKAAAAASVAPSLASSPSPSPTPTPTPTPTPSAKTSPSAKPSPSAKSGPAAALALLRSSVAQSDFDRDRDRQQDLLERLDEAADALGDRQPDDAARSLKEAQKMVRDLGKRHAIDGDTSLLWQAKIGAVIALVG
ncbi:protein kinase [Kitasatospora sp. NPDC096147]|uniref:protein kinase domain-containing protein n=1 Tax=Kitasatospora sp. NPDC096147 TaxID=3364093 RepID=UPI00380DC6B8